MPKRFKKILIWLAAFIALYVFFCVPVFPKIKQSDLDKIKYATTYFAIDLFSPHNKDYVVLTIPDAYTNNPYLINDGSEAVDKTIERADKRTLFSTLWIKYRRSSFDRRAFYDEYVKKDMFDYYQDYNDPFYKNFNKEPDADKYFERWATRGKTRENPWFINRAGEYHWIEFKALYPDFLGVTPKTAKYFRQDNDVINIYIAAFDRRAVDTLGSTQKIFNKSFERDYDQIKNCIKECIEIKSFGLTAQLAETDIGLKRLGLSKTDLAKLKRIAGKGSAGQDANHIKYGNIIFRQDALFFKQDPHTKNVSTFINCDIIGSVPVPYCEHYFFVPELGAYIKMFYKNHMLSGWQHTENKALNMLLKSIVTYQDFK